MAGIGCCLVRRREYPQWEAYHYPCRNRVATLMESFGGGLVAFGTIGFVQSFSGDNNYPALSCSR